MRGFIRLDRSVDLADHPDAVLCVVWPPRPIDAPELFVVEDTMDARHRFEGAMHNMFAKGGDIPSVQYFRPDTRDLRIALERAAVGYHKAPITKPPTCEDIGQPQGAEYVSPEMRAMLKLNDKRTMTNEWRAANHHHEFDHDRRCKLCGLAERVYRAEREPGLCPKALLVNDIVWIDYTAPLVSYFGRAVVLHTNPLWVRFIFMSKTIDRAISLTDVVGGPYRKTTGDRQPVLGGGHAG